MAGRCNRGVVVRLIGQGRLCECLKDDDESLAIDIFMRQMGLAGTGALAVTGAPSS